MMKRILVLGCSGSGKSTLSIALGKRLDLPVVHLDQLWWRPGWVERTREEFDALLARELTKERWIIDGNFARTLPMRLPCCDTVLYLDYSRARCLWQAVKRMAAFRGRTRTDMTEGCTERLDPEFVRYIWNFKRDQRDQTLALVQKSGKDVHIFRSRRACAAFLNSL